MPQYKGGRNINKAGYGGAPREPKATGKVTKIIGRAGETVWAAPPSKAGKMAPPSRPLATMARSRMLGR